MRHPDETTEYGILAPEPAHAASIPVSRRLISIWRHKWLALTCVALMMLAGVVYISQRSTVYTANGLLLVENTTLDPGRQELIPSLGVVDTSLVESQIEIIKTDAIALEVIRKLNLAEVNDPDSVQSWIDGIKSSLPGSPPSTLVDNADPARVALPAFSRSLSVKRIGTTYLIDVRFTAKDPVRAAQVTNEVIQTYLVHQEQAGAAAAATASAWLRDRIKDLGPKARVISSASSPLKPDGPGRLALLGSFTGIGVLLGIGLAVSRAMLDRTLRDPLEAELKLGANYLGAVVKTSAVLRSNSGGAQGPTTDKNGMKEVPPALRHAVDAPYSYIGNSMTRVRAVLARASSPSIIGVTSTVAGEGATTIAANLAASAAAAGSRVLLVDGNSASPDLTRCLGGSIDAGPISLAQASTDLTLSIPGCMSKLDFQSWAGLLPLNQSSQSQADLAGRVRGWRERYDLVIIDLPSLLPAADVAFTRNFVDAILLVVQWGKVTDSLIQNALGASGLNTDDLLGIVFNKVKPSAINPTLFPIETYVKQQPAAGPASRNTLQVPSASRLLQTIPGKAVEVEKNRVHAHAQHQRH
jgi:succinoglycan biosynthesis transport protein ExoP